MYRRRNDQPRRSIATMVAALVLVTAAPVARPAKGIKTFSLKNGEAVFWTGAWEDHPGNDRPYEFRLHLAERAWRLRIGIDHPRIGDVFTVVLTNPAGEQLPAFSPSEFLYSAEQVVRDPGPGLWHIEVYADDLSESGFRMRAKLETRPPFFGAKNDLVLPNLQVLPPHDPSFLMPVTNGGQDLQPTGADTKGAESCHPEEHAEDGAIRCLRFAFGVRNTGDGPLYLVLGDGAELQDRELFQRVARADGTYSERPAGVAKYHKTHAHYHHDGAIGLRLYKETESNGKKRLEPVGPMRTKGFAHREELLRDWERFYPIWKDPIPFGLGAGWADIYEWDRPGNYIDFGLNDDGYYVIRMWADPVEGILESNEKDNLAYAYMRVEGPLVELLEVGRGMDPWDECKIVMGPGGYPDPPRREQPRRPRSCPPDTT